MSQVQACAVCSSQQARVLHMIQQVRSRACLDATLWRDRANESRNGRASIRGDIFASLQI